MCILKKEQNVLKEKNLCFEKENQVLKSFSKWQDSKISNLKKGCTLKSFDKLDVLKRYNFSKKKSFQRQKLFSHEFSKINVICQKTVFKQSHFLKGISKKKDFVSTSSYVHKSFSHHLNKKNVFKCSKYTCFHCNQNGHFVHTCPFKHNAYFKAKMIWVPRTNPQGPNIRWVPNIT